MLIPTFYGSQEYIIIHTLIKITHKGNQNNEVIFFF